jgi:DNA-binding CsgD family transcriptional regulator
VTEQVRNKGTSRVAAPLDPAPHAPHASTFSLDGEPASLASRILDGSFRSVFAVASDRRILYRNRAAEMAAARGEIVRIHDERLVFADQLVQNRVSRHIADMPPRHWKPAARGLLLHTGLANSSYSRILVTLLEGASQAQSSHEHVWLVFVSERLNERHIHHDVLAQLYGLTEAESALVAQLFSGRYLEEAAHVQCISINTAKTHLKRVFHKCAVQSQAELLQLLALGPRRL